ncbi:MAG: Ig-like domain-containing protein [Gemmatirosa sp.]
MLLPLVLGLTVWGLAGCSGGSDGPPPEPTGVSLAEPGTTLAGSVGADLAAPVRVRVTAAGGRAVRGATVTWTPADGGRATPAASVTDADGVATTVWTLGSTAGVQSLAASAGTVVVRTQLLATAVPGRAAAVRVQGDSSLGLVPGLTLTLSAVVADRFGNLLPAAPLAWRSADPTVVTVDEAGRVIARAPGATTIEATADTARARWAVRVESASGLAISRLSSDTLVPGSTVTVEGAGFVPTAGGTQVFVSGVRANALEITPTSIRFVVPSVTALPCQSTGAGTVTVRRDLATGVVDSARRAVALPVATRRTLRVGESVAMLTTDEARCTQLEGGGRYVLSVFSTDLSGDRFAFAQLRGTAATTAVAGPVAARTVSRAVVPRPSAAAPSATEQQEMRVAGEHGARLEWERTMVRRAGSPVAALRAARLRGEVGGPRLVGRARRPAASRTLSPSAAPSASLAAAAPALGDTVALNVYNLSSRSCARAIPVRARVVYVGTRSVVYEDVANGQAGTMDGEYRQVGEEFDQVMFPILQRNFGEPLAMDGQLDRDGRIGMIFSKVLNDSMPNVLGFVTSCNFYPRSDPSFAASNEMELFYARAPRPGEGASAWRYGLRSTTIHEVKHITAFGEKIARAAGDVPNYEDSWLEESTARVSEELFARAFSGASWRGNTGFESTVGCELTRCDDRPYSMAKHWTTLHLFYRNVGALSPFAGSNDFNATFYASGWSLMRWAMDHYAGSDEAAFLRAITLEPRLTGLANISARTGRPPNEMLADWGLAMYVDDAPGLTPARAQLSFPSWNGREILRGLNGFSASSYPGAFPLAVQPLSFGTFQSPDLLLRGWSTAFFELSGAPTAPQLIELRAPTGGAASPSVRMAIIRVE